MTDIPNINSQAEVFDGNTVFDDVWILNKLHYNFSQDDITARNLTITGIATFGTSSTTIDGATDTIQVGTALTLGHTQGLQFHTQNLHSEGFEVNQVNISGIATVGSDLYLTGALRDTGGSTGSSGQLLASTGSGTDWINANTTSVANAINVGVTADSTNDDQFISFFGGSSGNRPNLVDSQFRYNPSTNTMMGINHSHTSTFTNTKVTGIATAATLEVEGQLRDGDGNFGSAGQVLTSDGTDTKWDASSNLPAGSSAQIAITDVSSGTPRLLLATGSGTQKDVLSNSSLTYNTSSQVISGKISDISNHDTGDLSEGSNLYHTTARARSAISASGALSYNSSTGVMSFSGGNDTLDNVCDRGATTNQAITAQGGVSDGSGDLRVIINNTKSGSYTLTSADVGELINTNSQVTVPSGVFSAGQAISIYNNSGSGITIAQGGSVTMYLAGSNTTGNRALSSRGVATVLCVASNTFTIMGAGLA